MREGRGKEGKIEGEGKKKDDFRTSLVVQWLRIHLPIQGMQI